MANINYQRKDFNSSLRWGVLLFITLFSWTEKSALAFAPTIRTNQGAQDVRVTRSIGSFKTYRAGSSSSITNCESRAAGSRSAKSFELKMWGNDDNINGRDRVLSCVPYLLPLLDGDHFGKYIYQRVPPLGLLDAILLGPLEAIYHSIPFLGLGLFILLSFQSRNTDLSRPVRFNMQQAILIDIALIFPELFGAFGGGSFALPRYIVEPASNFVYYAFIAAIGYSIVNNLRGKKPNQIPWISDAAEMQIGPF